MAERLIRILEVIEEHSEVVLSELKSRLRAIPASVYFVMVQDLHKTHPVEWTWIKERDLVEARGWIARGMSSKTSSETSRSLCSTMYSVFAYVENYTPEQLAPIWGHLEAFLTSQF